MSKIDVLGSAVTASLSGLLTRPCCVLPIALSGFGLSSAVVGRLVADYRPALLTGSFMLLAASLVITMRRDGGGASKVIAVSTSIAAFLIARAWSGQF